MVLNDQTIIPDLDIFAQVGMATAYDVVTKFSVADGQLKVGGKTSDFDGMLSVKFSKVNFLC